MKDRVGKGMAGMLAMSSLFRLFKKSAGDYFRLQGAMAYLKGVELVHEIFLVQLGILTCTSFLIFGIMLMEVAIIFLLPLNMTDRALAALIVGALDALIAFSFIHHFISSERWLRHAAKYNSRIEEWLEEGAQCGEPLTTEKIKRRRTP